MTGWPIQYTRRTPPWYRTAIASSTRLRYSFFQPSLPNWWILPDDVCSGWLSLAPNMTATAPGSNALTCDWNRAGQLKKSGRTRPVERR